MQKKVSKHHLLSISLAIILVITMMTNATLAAFSSTATASGNITFDGNVIASITVNTGGPTLSGNTGNSITMTFTANISAADLKTALGKVKIGLGSGSTKAYLGVKIWISNDANSVVSLSTQEASNIVVTGSTKTNFTAISGATNAYVSSYQFAAGQAVEINSLINTLTFTNTNITSASDSAQVNVKLVAKTTKNNITSSDFA